MELYIKNIVEKIVNKEFTSNIERNVILHSDRIQFRCPYCHEGRTKTKKRGNIYFNKLLFICFRCGHKSSLDQFVKDFDEQIDPTTKLKMIEHLNNVVSYNDYDSDLMETKYDDLIDINDLSNIFNSNLTNITNFEPIVMNSGVYKFLTNRGIDANLQKNIYQAKYWKNEDEYEWVIAMLNRKDNKILGMQLRNLKSGKRRFFKIYNYENLLEILIDNNINYDRYLSLKNDLTKLVIYNKLSYYFNILNINFDIKITIFEGYLDSLFYPNSIGLVGVNTDSKFLESNNLEIQYFYDNDKVGFKKSEEKLKNGYSVFLWNKLFYEISNSKNNNDPYSVYNRISKIKDLNKLSEIVKNPYTKLNLGNYFSHDLFDIKWIPKNNSRKVSDIDYNNKFKIFE